MNTYLRPFFFEPFSSRSPVRFRLEFAPLVQRMLLGSLVAASCGTTFSAPYATNLTVSGTAVSFILNEAADAVTFSINGGPAQSLATSPGTIAFSLNSPTDDFEIVASKSSGQGWINATGATAPLSATGLSQPTNTGVFSLISSDSNPLLRFNSPRGVSVNVHPNSPNFGTAYISNTAAGSVAANAGSITGSAARPSLTKGMYALRADQTDAFGYNNTGQNAAWDNGSTSTPWKPNVAPDGNVYISDFSDATGTVWRMSGTLTDGTAVFSGNGSSTVPAGQYHGSTTTVWVTGTGNELTLYTIDEDLTPAGVPGATSTVPGSKLNVWAYDLGTSSLPYANPPKLVNSSPLIINSQNNVVRGTDGKIYLSQNRSAGAEAGLFVLDASGNTLFNSLTASRALLGSNTAADIFTNVFGIDVSPDQNWLAAVLNNSDIAVMPLVNGIPDIASRLLIDTGTNINSGRDISFDAANNIHYVSSGQQIYRVLSTGGESVATTSYNGGIASFSLTLVPEPSSVALACFGVGSVAVCCRALIRRRTRGSESASNSSSP